VFGFIGKKSAFEKVALKKKAPVKSTAENEQNAKAAGNSQKDTVGGSVVEKVAEKMRQSGKVDKARRYKQHDKAKQLDARKFHNSRASEKMPLKKPRTEGVSHQQLQHVIPTDVVDKDILQHSMPDYPDSAKKPKLSDTVAKETKSKERNLVEHRKKESAERSHGSSFVNNQKGSLNKVHLSSEKHQKDGGKVVTKSEIFEKKDMVESRSDDSHSSTTREKSEKQSDDRSRDAARQHVRHALCRALSAR